MWYAAPSPSIMYDNLVCRLSQSCVQFLVLRIITSSYHQLFKGFKFGFLRLTGCIAAVILSCFGRLKASIKKISGFQPIHFLANLQDCFLNNCVKGASYELLKKKQIEYIHWLLSEAHKFGLKAGLKNAMPIIKYFYDDMDFGINEVYKNGPCLRLVQLLLYLKCDPTFLVFSPPNHNQACRRFGSKLADPAFLSFLFVHKLYANRISFWRGTTNSAAEAHQTKHKMVLTGVYAVQRMRAVQEVCLGGQGDFQRRVPGKPRQHLQGSQAPKVPHEIPQEGPMA
jgi:hypothetical protein